MLWFWNNLWANQLTKHFQNAPSKQKKVSSDVSNAEMKVLRVSERWGGKIFIEYKYVLKLSDMIIVCVLVL